MVDETPQSTGAAGPERATEPRDSILAYCQQCGRGLTASTQRRVGTGIFCEPCAAVRMSQASGWTPVNTATSYSAGSPNMSASSTAGEPNPMFAGFLGLIPGVGAMFNGQYAKGVIHLIVFVVLVSLADHAYWVFWWFVWGWIFYQAFEAYHTAQARRDGQPLPDPFGWNELGERLGFARTWSPVQPAAAQTPTAPPPVSSATYAAPATAAAAYSQAGSNPYTAPVTGFTSVASAVPGPETPYSPPGSPDAGSANTGSPGPTRTPYMPINTGNVDQTSGQTFGHASGQAPLLAETRLFPVGAAWLIGLGVLFLLGNLLPTWHLDGRWLLPLLLAAVGLWMGASRLILLRQRPSSQISAQPRTNFAGLLLWPFLLLTVSLLLALQNASRLLVRHSWPVLLIVWGGLLLLQRAEEARQAPSATDVEGPAVAATASPETSPR